MADVVLNRYDCKLRLQMPKFHTKFCTKPHHHYKYVCTSFGGGGGGSGDGGTGSGIFPGGGTFSGGGSFSGSGGTFTGTSGTLSGTGGTFSGTESPFIPIPPTSTVPIGHPPFWLSIIFLILLWFVGKKCVGR